MFCRRRQQRLEEEYADIEFQIRCLMHQPEVNKTDFHKAREEELIKRLVEIVECRDEIIQCLEMDRVREAEEDDSINNQLTLYTLKRDEGVTVGKAHEEEKRNKKKGKKSKGRSPKKFDDDKDIDECETLSMSSASSSSTMKEKKKKRFHIF